MNVLKHVQIPFSFHLLSHPHSFSLCYPQLVLIAKHMLLDEGMTGTGMMLKNAWPLWTEHCQSVSLTQSKNLIALTLKFFLFKRRFKTMVVVFFVLIRFSGCGWEIPVKYLWLGLSSSSIVPFTGGQMAMGEHQDILCVCVFWDVCYSEMHKAKMSSTRDPLPM